MEEEEEEEKARRIHPWLWRLRNHLIASQWAIQRGKKVVFVLHKLCIKSLAKPFSGIALEVFSLFICESAVFKAILASQILQKLSVFTLKLTRV